MQESENVQKQFEAQKNMLEKLSKMLDDQNKEISHLTTLIDKQNEFIKRMGGELEKNDNKKSSQNKIHKSKKTDRSHQLQDSIKAIASEISEQDNRISKLKNVINNNKNKILSLALSTSKKLDKLGSDDVLKFCDSPNSSNKKLSADDLSKLCKLVDVKRTDDKSMSDFINAYNKKLGSDDVLKLCKLCDDKLDQSGMQCIYKSSEKEVFGFKFDLSSYNYNHGNKSIFQNKSNLGCQFNCDLPSCDNQDYKLDEDEK